MFSYSVVFNGGCTSGAVLSDGSFLMLMLCSTRAVLLIVFMHIFVVVFNCMSYGIHNQVYVVRLLMHGSHTIGFFASGNHLRCQ